MVGSEDNGRRSEESDANSELSDNCSSRGHGIISMVGSIVCTHVAGAHWILSSRDCISDVVFIVGGSLGGLFGGRMGDIIARRLPNAGRIILSQISSGLAIPLSAVLLLVLPRDPSTGLGHGLMFFIMGFSISWNGAATNK
jgi:hypothetical protein